MKKTKILVATLLAGFVLNHVALCQTNAPDANPPIASGAAASPAASIAIPDTSASNAPVAMTVSNEPVSMSNAVVSAAAASAPVGAIELPIQFQDVPITTAIESLTRLAGINYLLDPKIGYGQPDANGQIKPEPTLSIRWENVTAQKALLALLDNYGLQLVENPKTGIYKITTKDPSAPPPMITRVIQLKYASTSNMQASVEGTLTDKRSRVVPDARTSQLVVVATEPEQSDVDTLINQLDKPTRQVLIETKLIELSSAPTTSKGIDWSGTLQAQNVSFGNGILQSSSKSTTTIGPVTTPVATTPGGAVQSAPGTPASTSSGISTLTSLITQPQNSSTAGGLSLNTASGLTPNIGFLSADGAQAVLSFLDQSEDAQVVSTPRVVTLDNETATISVTRAFPIINVTAGTANTTGGSQITYSNLGTILMVTPRISANDYIWLKVNPVVSSFFGQDKQVIGGQITTADIFDLRSIDTQVLIPNNHTLVMGGLVKDDPNATYSKVPVLGDIPGLGWAFRHETKSMEKDNLLIFITPTIVQESDYKPTKSTFLDSQPKTFKDPMDMSSKWDNAEPAGDWSDPLRADQAGDLQQPGAGKAPATP